jgi:hypothetical protein
MARWLTIKWLATILCIAFFTFGALLPSARAQDNASTRQSLQGIDTVSVLVEHLPASAGTLGLAADDIQTDVELKLVTRGVHVVPQEDHYKLPGMPYLYINVNLAADGRVASVDVELRQNARLERKSDQVTVVSTWSVGTLMEDPTDTRIRQRIKDGVDTFLTAWLAANPQK